MAVPALGFAAWLVQELVRVSSRTYCGCLRTFSEPKLLSLRAFFASNGDCPPCYVTDNGGKVGGKVGGNVPSFVTSLVPSLSQILSQDEEKDANIDAQDATSSSKVATLDEKVASLEPKDTKVKKKA